MRVRRCRRRSSRRASARLCLPPERAHRRRTEGSNQIKDGRSREPSSKSGYPRLCGPRRRSPARSRCDPGRLSRPVIPDDRHLQSWTGHGRTGRGMTPGPPAYPPSSRPSRRNEHARRAFGSGHVARPEAPDSAPTAPLPRGNSLFATCQDARLQPRRPRTPRQTVRGQAVADASTGSTFTPGPIVEEIATRWM